MVRYSPKELKGNPNISSTPFLKELFILLGGILGIVLAAYIALGLMVDLIVPKLPETLEQDLAKLFTKKYVEQDREIKAEQEIQQLLDSLAGQLPSSKIEYTVRVAKSPQVNALALPGGNIVVLSGLLDEVESENELAFVLAHELGHFANRDHLKGLGRGLALLFLSTVVLGQNNAASAFLRDSLGRTEMKFSQTQERNADLFALDLLNKKYGHVKGAVSFMEKMRKLEKVPRFLYFFATHPHPRNRLKTVKEKVNEKGYLIKEVIPLDKSLKEIIRLQEAKDKGQNDDQ